MAEHKSSLTELTANTVHRIRELKAELKREEQALEASRASRFGEDIYVTGDVLRFDKSFGSGETYPYAAIKANDGYWRTCGRRAWQVWCNWKPTEVKFTMKQLAVSIVVAGVIVAASIGTAFARAISKGIDLDWEPWGEDLDWLDAELSQGEWLDPA